ncbi:MAG: hypothetical protein U1F46_16680 [Marinagarivorans sp.]
MEYLDALGIEQFVPRKRLLGAKSSLALLRVHSPVETTPATKVALPPIESAEVSAPQPVAKLVSQVTERLIAPDNTPSTRSATPAQPAAPTGLVTPQKVLRFALTVWHLPGWLWIDSRQSQQALPTDALLHNILAALRLKEPVKPEVIKWPPVESPLQVQDWAQAREMMNSFLTPRLLPGERLILMGEAAYNACTQGPFDYAERLAANDLQHPPHPCLLLPSLAQILTEPALKAEVWRRLQRV